MSSNQESKTAVEASQRELTEAELDEVQGGNSYRDSRRQAAERGYNSRKDKYTGTPRG